MNAPHYNREMLNNVISMGDRERYTIHTVINRFPSYLSQKGMAASTIEAYMSDMKLFVKFMGDKYKYTVYVDQLTKSQFLDYFSALNSFTYKGKKYKRTTIDRKKDAILTFSHYLFDCEYTLSDILGNYTYFRIGRGFRPPDSEGFNPYILSDDEINLILGTIMTSSDRNKYRDFAIFLMLTEFGCRRSTVLSSKLEDLNFY